VIEDSQHGIDAAKSAGAMCIGLLTTHQRLSGADFIASSFEEIGEILMIK
jgi:beta-phosphoglucomutase-like phosphatase (HAD superfamily)